MPPKNITSVARKIHMPSSAASFCCSASSNWCATWSTAAAWSANLRLRAGVVVRRARDDRGPLEVLARRGRRRLPLEAGRVPRVRRSEEHTSELQSPDHLVCSLLLDTKK